MLTLSKEQIQVRMGEANVDCRVGGVMPLLIDPPGFESLAMPRILPKEALGGYYISQKKQDSVTKILLRSSNVGSFSGWREMEAD